jgi:hypothetical protein
MFGSRKKSIAKYQTALIDDATTWQFGFAGLLKDNRNWLLLPNTGRDPAIFAGMANWMFRFGDYGPKCEEDPSLKSEVDGAFQNFHRLPADEDRAAELTLALIIAAAAQDVPMATFKTHFDKLCGLGVVMNRINISGFEQRLAEHHKPYYYYMQYGD